MSELGYESCRQVTRKHGRSFAFAAFALPQQKRRAAYAVYAFFRRLDDATDVARHNVLADAGSAVAYLFEEGQAPDSVWPQEELRALRHAIAEHALPRAPFEQMLLGMEMDLRGDTYEGDADLDLYCDRVAGTVGEIMAALLGVRDPSALEAAVRLGRAMQLTNILRDVREDLEGGRVYLPKQMLARHALSANDLRAPDERWRALATAHIARTRALYASVWGGVAAIGSFSGRFLVAMMAFIYGDILRVIERQQHDVFSQRARVGFARKLVLMCSAFGSALRVRA